MLKGATGLYKPVGGSEASFCMILNTYKQFRSETLQASTMKVAHFILTKMFYHQKLEKEKNCHIQNLKLRESG